MCAYSHHFFARRKQGSKNEWRKTYQQTFGQTRGPWQPIQPQPYNSIMLTRRNEMGWDGWGSGFFIKKNHLASCQWTLRWILMICLVMAFYFAYMHANSPGKEHKKKLHCQVLFANLWRQQTWINQVGSRRRNTYWMQFFENEPVALMKKKPETWKTAKNPKKIEK
jgi:hypothetical protein